MKLTRRRLLSNAIAIGSTMGLNQKFLSAATSLGIIPRDLADDPRRPQFHLLPPSNWINDPNGPIYWNGLYHMFYQYNPAAPFFGKMVWGHAVSPDMLHWKHMPIALTPTPGGPDAAGCWTGTAVADQGVVTVLYTGVAAAPKNQATADFFGLPLHESQCLAYSTDPDLKTWTKLPVPVIAGPPPGMEVSGFRDPSPWRQGDAWYTTVGSGTPHKNGELLLYRSKDLRHWEYQHLIAGGEGPGDDPAHTGPMWECPELFPLGEKHVLIYSCGKTHWEVGMLDTQEMQFHSEQQGVLDYGDYYAPKTQRDKDGNRIIWGWVQETRPEKEYRAAGWAGMMSLPRVLTVESTGRLAVNVSPVVDSLRKNHQRLHITADEEKNRRRIGGMHIENGCGEILCTARISNEPFALTVFGALPDGGAEIHCAEIHFDPSVPHQMTVDGQPVPVEIRNDTGLEFHIYVDGSVAEIFLNKQAACTKRFYYPGTQAPKIGVRIAGKTAEISNLSFWQLAPISAHRLTT